MNTVHRLEYTWKIDHFSYYSSKENDFDSPVFVATSHNEYKWRLRLKFIDDNATWKDYIGLFLIVDHINTTIGTIFAKYKVSVLDRQQEILRSRICDKIRGFKLRRKERGWGYRKFIPKDSIVDGELLSNDQLTLHCSIIFSEVNNFTDDFDHDMLPPEATFTGYTLSENFGTLLTSKDHSDVVLVVKDEKFYVHKAILAARSPVFDAMFKTPLLENERNCVEIKDLDIQVVEQMLRYIYTGKCDKLEECADGLFVAADKYDLTGLKLKCEAALYKSLSVENAPRTLILADMHRASKLKQNVINFIVANSRQVVATTIWDDLVTCFPQLLNEVFKATLLQQANTSAN